MPSRSAYDERLGMRCEHAGGGHATYRVDVDASMHNPTGRLHGGLLASLADAAMGAAFLSDVVPGQGGTNLDLDIHFLRRVAGGALIATARTVKSGATVSLLACDIHDEAGHLVAVAQSQFMRLAS